MRQLTYDGSYKGRAVANDGTELSDEAVKEAADFGIFIDLASMKQKEEEPWKLGLYWLEVNDKEPPAESTALECASLLDALVRGKTSFTRQEIDEFIIKGLSWSSHIRVADTHYFMPTGKSPVETALFKHALGSLDVIYAHKAMASFLSTVAPIGVPLDRGYDSRGWYAASAFRPAGSHRLLAHSSYLLASAGAILSARRGS